MVFLRIPVGEGSDLSKQPRKLPETLQEKTVLLSRDQTD